MPPIESHKRIVSKVKKAQFISYQPSSEQFEMAPQFQSVSQLSIGGKQD